MTRVLSCDVKSGSWTPSAHLRGCRRVPPPSATNVNRASPIERQRAFTRSTRVKPVGDAHPRTTTAARASPRSEPTPTTVANAHESAPSPIDTKQWMLDCAAGVSRTLATFAVILGTTLPLSPPNVSDVALAEVVEQSVASGSTASSATAPAKPASRRYLFVTGFPFPLGPFTERRTVETELVKDRVYTFEQEISLAGISANVRSTVFRTRDNHLVVYNPVAPTEEFLQQLEGLGSAGVSHVLLGATQYEHKVFVGPFARRFPDAKVWAVPDQWSFPVDLPPSFLGIDTKGSGGGELVDSAGAGGAAAYAGAPDLAAEFEVKLLRPPRRLAFGYAANEAAVLHKDTKTLALTDALVNVPPRPPAIYDTATLRDIGDNSRDSGSLGNLVLRATSAVNWRGTAAEDIGALWAATEAQGQGAPPAQVQRGWERNVLFSLYTLAGPASVVDPAPSFSSLAGRWIVAPVTDALIYRSDRVKPELARWVEDVARWDFEMISPSHFDARAGTADDFRAAFAPTLAGTRSPERPYDKEDVRFLDDAADQLVKIHVI